MKKLTFQTTKAYNALPIEIENANTNSFELKLKNHLENMFFSSNDFVI